jgi:DNA-binding transcriptional ArsR family regulator
MSFETAEDAGPEEPTSSPVDPVEITDPRALRALAHPARIAIMQHLILEGPATATQCADFAGLSPSACSYHLRALARYGFVQEDRSGAADGRHRPWRARMVAISVGEDPDRPRPVRAAGRLLLDSLQARVDEVRANYLDREADYPREWQLAAGLQQDVLHVTAAELNELKASFRQAIGRYRRLRPSERPAGTRRVHVIVDFTPWFDPEEDA